MKRIMMLQRMAVVALCIFGSSAYADVKLAQMFSDNMVLQRDMKVPVWGQAKPGEQGGLAGVPVPHG